MECSRIKLFPRASRRAFTLVELLVVIAIIGLLSTIAVVSLNQARSKSHDAKRTADIRQIIVAMQAYREDNGTYPNTGTLGCAGAGPGVYYCLGHGDSGTCWTGAAHGCTTLDNALSPYMAKIPDDPKNNTAYLGDAYAYQYSGAMVSTSAPLLHWALDAQTNRTSCFGGEAGQWGVNGNWRWYCIFSLPQ